MKTILITLAIALAPFWAWSQDTIVSQSETAPIKVISQYHNGAILLRWGPITEGHWLNGKNSGYQIRRQELNTGSDTPSKKEVLIEVCKPWSFDQFKSYVDGNGSQNEVMIMGESLYGEWESIGRKTKGLKDWGLRSEELKGKYLMALLSADLNFNAAVSGGIGYRDTTVEPGKKYAYYVTMVGYDNYLSAVEVADTRSEAKPPIVRIDDTGERELQVDLSWSRRLYTRHYTAYQIETSVDGNEYSKINDIPYINTQTDDVAASSDAIIYTHRLTENYKPLYYRVRGVNAFGLLSEPSEAIRLMGRDRTPPTPPAIDSVMTDPNMGAMRLNWDYTTEDTDLELTRIKRSTHATGVYQDLVDLPPFQTSYQDVIDGEHVRYYYQVCAVDTASNVACAGPRLGIINDQVPPAAPTGLSASIDSSGIVTIDWDDNTEKDVRGYYIQLSNGKNRVFSSLVHKPWQESKFTDTLTLNTLTEDIYYRVNAIDYSNNVGDHSQIIRLVKPDTIPPTASVIYKYESKKDYIKLLYKLSQSKDAVRYVLQRKSKQTQWQDKAELDKDSKAYTDSDLKSNTLYTYRIKTWDDADNLSTELVEMRVKSPNMKLTLVPVLQITQIGEEVKLTWTQPTEANTDIRIYKGSTEKQLFSFKKVENQTGFVDKLDTASHYRIRLYYSDGTHSPYSNIVKASN